MNSSTTKKTLTISIISIFVCIAALVGATYAWFTDTAQTDVNTIQAGTLKIDIQDSEGNSLNGNTLKFVNNEGAELTNILWEPNCTYKLQEAKLVNLGNLALKFKVEIKGLEGDTKLADAIEVKIGGESKGTLADLMVDPDGAAYGYLLPAGTASIGQIELHMLESAGNEYQGLKLEGISIFVSATQYTHESDSYGKTYDANADYAPIQADYYVSTSEDLVAKLKDAEVGEIVAAKTGSYAISENVETNGTLIVESGEAVSLTLTNGSLKSVVSKEQNAPTVKNYGTLAITGGTITNKNATADNTDVAAVHNVSGTVTLVDCTIENTAPTSGGNYAVVIDGGKAALSNCTVVGGRGGIAVSGAGYVEMNGGSVTASRYYPLYTRGSGASTFNQVTFIKDNTKSKAITYNAFGTDGGTVAFTDCTFKSTNTGASFDISNVITGFTFSNCQFQNVKDPTA